MSEIVQLTCYNKPDKVIHTGSGNVKYENWLKAEKKRIGNGTIRKEKGKIALFITA